jgi:GT2 family glycosyltransferase
MFALPGNVLMHGITVVVATKDRRERLLATLARHEEPVIVVDNGSTDGTPAAVREAFPGVRVISLDRNTGAAARTLGAGLAKTEYVAFADDDSYWAPGSLSAAVDLLDSHPSLGLVCARVLVGDDNRLDPVSEFMELAPLGIAPDLPGPPVLGFLACAAAVRRSAFLEAGGFPEPLGTYGEEELLALNLAAHGWEQVHAKDLVVHHYPDRGRPSRRRLALQARNSLLTAVMRRSARTAAQRFGDSLRTSPGRLGLLMALSRLPWALPRRRPVPPRVERAARTLEREWARYTT